MRTVQLVRPTWDGEDDVVLTVSGPSAVDGITLMEGAMQEMYHAPRTTPEQALASLPGAIPAPDRIGTRTFTLRILTEETALLPWEDVDSYLWSVARPNNDWWVRVGSAGGSEARQITVRRTGTPELVHPDGLDPGQDGAAIWDIEVTAYDPFWYGTPVTDEHRNHAQGTETATLTLRNYGDQDAWVRYIIRESGRPQTITVPDGLGEYPDGHEHEGERIMHELPEIAAGKHGLVDTSPQRIPLSVYREPMAFGKLRQTRFTHAIPANTTTVELPVEVTGDSDAGVRAKLTPRYERPYGRTL